MRVRYAEAGRVHGGTPLLMVHGYNGALDYWYPNCLPLLAGERHVIALDLPGNGLSGRLPQYSLEIYAAFLVAFMDAIGLQTADLLGHSLGGQIAIAAAAHHPQRFHKLVLMDSAGLPELVKTPWMAPIKMLGDSSLRQVRLYPTLVWIGMKARASREGLLILRTASVRRELKQIHMPTLILWGSRDRVVPLEHGFFMAKHIEGARLAVIRGAGHMPFYEKPQECSRIVLGFLRG